MKVDIQQLFSVRGRSAIVTGGASGLGLAIAEVLVSGGARVTLFDLNESALAQQAERLQLQGAEVRAQRLDVTDWASLDELFEAAAQAQGGLDIVFANAGIDAGPGFLSPDRTRIPEHQIDQYSDERWRRVMDVNLDAVFHSVRASARLMKPAGKGSIVVTTSISAIRPSPSVGMAYAAAKAGAAHLVRASALELARHGIRVNAIAPGPFATNIAAHRADSKDFLRNLAAAVPLGRMAHPDEVKGLALLLASDASAFITGEQIVIDGGSSLGAAD